MFGERTRFNNQSTAATTCGGARGTSECGDLYAEKERERERTGLERERGRAKSVAVTRII